MTAYSKLLDQIGSTSFLSLDDANHHLKIANVIDILNINKFVKIHGMPESFTGIVNLHNRVIPVVDGRTRFKPLTGGPDNQACIIVMNVNAIDIGLLIDETRILWLIFRKAMLDCRLSAASKPLPARQNASTCLPVMPSPEPGLVC